MRAAVVTSFDSPPHPADFADPVADAAEQVVDVELAAVNPVDLLIASGKFYAAVPPVPSVAGREGIARMPDGSLAYFDSPLPPFGSIGERTLLAAGATWPLPEGLAPEPALACGIAGLAAYLSLTHRAGLKPGEGVLVLGAGGAVGQVGVVAAKLLGAGRVVAAARGAASLERAAELGADATVSLTGSVSEVAAAIAEAFSGEGPDIVIDPLWGEPAEAAVQAMAFGGRLVQLGRSAGDTATFDSAAIRGRCLQLIGHTNFANTAEEKGEALSTMFGWAREGLLEVGHEVLPLASIGEAWQRQAEGPGLKLLIDPRG
ncbi:MAG: zinc-binding dehydrogenase [Actinomycetes bacterium]